MTRDEAIAVLQLPPDKAIDTILALAEKAEKYDQLCGHVTASTPSAMTPTYLKPTPQRRPKQPGRRKAMKGSTVFSPKRWIISKNTALSVVRIAKHL